MAVISRARIYFSATIFLSALLFVSLFSSEKPDVLEKIAADNDFDHTGHQNVIASFFEDYFVEPLNNSWMTSLLAIALGALITVSLVVTIGKNNNKNVH